MTLFLVEIPKFLDQQLGGACRCKASRIHHEEGGMGHVFVDFFLDFFVEIYDVIFLLNNLLNGSTSNQRSSLTDFLQAVCFIMMQFGCSFFMFR